MIAAILIFASAVAAAEPPDTAAGKSLFERQWVAAPSPSQTGDGLGPFYDARSCSACHAGGRPGLLSNGIGTGLLVRLGRHDGTADPVYGAQLQTKALPGLAPEATVSIGWAVIDGHRIPSLHISDLGYGALAAQTYAAILRAPSLRGAAELESVADDAILAGEAREHLQGLSGHAQVFTDSSGQRIGRWGWKATSVDLTSQIAVALERDMGLSTSGHPDPWGDCTAAETACRDVAARNADRNIEVPDSERTLIVAYVESLPPPAALDQASPGAAVFRRIGCAGCHAPLAARDGTAVNAYSDLLLHDMGPELDDGIAEGGAKSSEWRTAPLWNVAEELAAGGLLHDGRARNIAEAVHWHGGEASRARKMFEALSAADKVAVQKCVFGH
jgi:CxxC motif-containing protein (DUF1111 family)